MPDATDSEPPVHPDRGRRRRCKPELLVQPVRLTIDKLSSQLPASFKGTVSITRPIRDAVRFARVAATGDLSARVSVARRDETGELLAALDAMLKAETPVRLGQRLAMRG